MFVVISTLGVIVFATPWFLAAVPIILYVYAYVQKIYIPTARELKRLDAIARSPIYSHFGETLGGVTTIRAFGDQERFTKENMTRLDRNQKAYNLTMVRVKKQALFLGRYSVHELTKCCTYMDPCRYPIDG